MTPLLTSTAIVAALIVPGAIRGAPVVDYATTVSCAYHASADGWVSVGRAPRGTDYVVFTMRTGVPGDWSSEDITSTSRARKWQVPTGPGMSFVNWVTFYSDEGWITSDMVNVRCEGAPDTWPE